MRFTVLPLTLMLSAWLLMACGSQASAVPSPHANLANPASAYCEEHGGTLEIRTEAGGQVGYCKFADGSECEEWAFFRGECLPAAQGAAICQETRLIAEEALGHRATVAEVSFQDPITGKSRNACQATITGTGADFRDPDDIVQKLKMALLSRGWSEDINYAADGATGTGIGMVSGERLCLLAAGWAPSEDTLCPADKPIFECELAPEQKLYTITLTCTR